MKNIRKITLKKRPLLSPNLYFEKIRTSDITALSLAITLLESSNPTNHELAEKIIDLCLPHSGNSIRIGITGIPGVGKSTFIEALGTYLIQKHNKKVAVLAIDPSSKKSGGSILGDKTRMNQLSTEKNAFIRPSPSSGSLGGVAKATRESIILCEAAGFDVILIETVGVGQSETDVISMVDFFLLLMLAGAGDELQGIKRGIMEMADTIVINKADSEEAQKVKIAQQNYKNALHLFPPNENEWIPKVTSCSALNQKGIDEIWEIIMSFANHTKIKGYFEENRKQQAKYWFKETITNALLDIFYHDKNIKEQIIGLEKDVMNGKISPFKAAQLLVGNFKK